VGDGKLQFLISAHVNPFSFRLDVHHMGSVNALWRHAYTPSFLERWEVERACAGARGEHKKR